MVSSRLIKNGVDPNERHVFGWTALHVAAFHGNVEYALVQSCRKLSIVNKVIVPFRAVLALILNGADINAVDEFAGVHAMVEKGRLNFDFIDSKSLFPRFIALIAQPEFFAFSYIRSSRAF